MEDILKAARERMKGYCRVCPICDGRACAGQVPGMGGLGTGSSFIANIQALGAVRFNMSVIHDVTEPDTRVTILGKNLSIPVFAAPIGGVAFNMGGKISEREYVDSVLKGCHEEGILGCTGDGVLTMLAMGANAVLIGRPISIAAMGGLMVGVKKYIDQIRSELTEAMILTGCRDITTVSDSLLYER